MKKAVPIIALLIAIGLIAFFTTKRRGSSGGDTVLELPKGGAARLAPAETVIFLELPDVTRTLQNFKQNGLYLLLQEPESQAFIAKWDEFAGQNEFLPTFFQVLAKIKSADPDGFFLALTDFSSMPFMDADNLPKFVGGAPCRGKKSEVEKVVRFFKDELFAAWPGAKSELSKHGDIEIETITSATAMESSASAPPVKATLNGRTVPPTVKGEDAQPAPVYSKVLLAYYDNWVFFATERSLLTDTLDRYLRKAGAPKSLADVPLFNESVKQGATEPDLTAWVFWQPIGTFLNEEIFGDSEDKKLVESMQAFHYTWKLDGPLMRDRLYLHPSAPPPVPTLANRSLAFTTTDTYAYAALDYDVLGRFVKWALTFPDVEDLEDLTEEFAKRGLKFDDLWTTFGSEAAIMSAWPDNAFALWPDFLATVEVRDPVKARKFVEMLVEGIGEEDGPPPKVTTEGDTTRWVWDLGLGGIAKPALVLNKTHLVLGLNPAALNNALKQLADKGPTVATKPGSEFAVALKAIPQPNGALFFLDTKTLVARAYKRLKPFFDDTLLGMPEFAKYFDYAKLPKEETIMKHLQPMTISLRTAGQGWIVESAGTVNAIGPQSIFLLLGASWVMDGPPAPLTPADKTEEAIFALDVKLAEYEEETGAFPTTQQGLAALVTKPTVAPIPAKWKQFVPVIPNDAWGNPLQYVFPGKKRIPETYDLFSSGPDGKPGTADDVRAE